MSEWISVKNRLPKSTERVLICDAQGWIFTGSYEDGQWQQTVGDECGIEVTHWMPLPRPPNE